MADTQPTQHGPGGRSLTEGWIDFVKGPSGIVAGIMALLALVGTGVTLASATWARTYWLVLVPIYGALCVFAAWQRTGQFSGTVMRQILHWLSVAIAMVLDFAVLQGASQQTAAATGLSSLLILALGCVLAGIHLDWLFVLVGVLLAAILVIVSLAKQYLTAGFLVAALAALVFAAYWVTRGRAPQRSPTPPA
jgi:hypothetical protein